MKPGQHRNKHHHPADCRSSALILLPVASDHRVRLWHNLLYKSSFSMTTSVSWQTHRLRAKLLPPLLRLLRLWHSTPFNDRVLGLSLLNIINRQSQPNRGLCKRVLL